MTDLNAHDDSQFEPIGRDSFDTAQEMAPENLQTSPAEQAATAEPAAAQSQEPLFQEQAAVDSRSHAEAFGQQENSASEETQENEDDDFDFTFEDEIANSNKAEVEEFNSKYGTQFNTMQEIRDSLSGKAEEAPVEEFAQERKTMSYIDELLALDTENLLLEDRKLEAYKAGKNIQDENVMMEIRSEVEDLIGSGRAETEARLVRQIHSLKRNEISGKVEAYDREQASKLESKQASFKSQTETAAMDILKNKNFYGVQVTKDEVVNAYKSVVNKNIVEKLNNDPKLALEFSLFQSKREAIQKGIGTRTYGDGVSDTFKELKGQKRIPVQRTVNNQTSNNDYENYLRDWTK